MVRFNNESVFRNVDLDDVDSIRRIMAALNYYLTNTILNIHVPELKAIKGEEREEEQSVVITILSRIRMMPNWLLLLRATLRFVESRDSSDEQVLVAAKELESLAPERVLSVPQIHVEEYDAAENFFNNRSRRVSPCVPIYELNRTLKEQAPGAFVNAQIFSCYTGAKLEELKKRRAGELRIPPDLMWPTSIWPEELNKRTTDVKPQIQDLPFRTGAKQEEPEKQMDAKPPTQGLPVRTTKWPGAVDW